MQQIEQEQVEQFSVDEPSFEAEAVVGTTVDAEGLHESLSEMADTFDVTGFKCVECGLAHMHDTTKHRLSDTFDVSESDAASMEYNSVCHCGVQEAGRHGSDLGIDESAAARTASNAPIPPESSQEMNNAFGSL
jgi:hypothetical protein